MAAQSFVDEADHIVELRRQVARLASDRLPLDKRIQLDRDHSWDPDDFRALADLGVIGLTIPEEYSGVGQDIVAAAAVIDELCQYGSSLAGPYIHAAFYGGMNISENGSA
ncbi:MAG: acyl-CoA dehydrogenase family protein, partial [Pseudomonadota bacterium]